MFSRLGPLFKTTLLREAERADTRLEIRRHEQDEESRKHDHEQDEDEGSFLWDDSTEVSVEALKNFLSEFLNSKTQAKSNKTSATSRVAPSVIPEHAPANPIAERAIKAYGITASHAAPPAVGTASEQTEPDLEEQDIPNDVESGDIRNMHVLIADLDVLSRRGVQTLTIEKADSFLEALMAAVRTAKASI